MVPWDLKRAILDNYVPGQEVTKRPTDSYLRVALRAVKMVAVREGIVDPVAGDG